MEATENVSNVIPYGVIKAYEDTMITLLHSHPFFAKLVMSMRKDFGFKPYTAAVSINSGGINLHLNPDFFLSLTKQERVAILMHESLHLVHGHLLRFKVKEDFHVANIAMDVAINQYIQDLPMNLSVPDGKGGIQQGAPVTYELLKQHFPEIQPKKSAEYYFQFLKQEQAKMPQMSTTDSHEEWKNTDLTEEQTEKLVKGHVKAIMESCSDKELEVLDKTVIDSYKKSIINWKAILRQFFANSEETFTERTRKKRNRRYGIFQAGIKNVNKLKIAIAVDTSGSISDAELNLFFSEIDHLFDENHMVLYVMEADTKIRDCYEYKVGMKIQAKGRGGTAYQAAIDKATELGVDACIYFGDGDAADVPQKPKYPLLWAMVRKDSNPFSFGKFMKVE